MFQVSSWPRAILHLDGDAFFASVIQAVRPGLRGKPVVVGKERGIATAISYEAKKYGIKRGMRADQIRKLCPGVLFVNSDYQIYGLFSQKILQIVKDFSPIVEQYSVDEVFADLTGLRRPLNLSYEKMGEKIKEKAESSLGISVSVGISLTKSLAKIASNFKKPSGLTFIKGKEIEKYLKNIVLEKVWGIGWNTASFLRKLGLKTALDLVLKDEEFIKKYLTKPYLEIWHELRGNQVFKLNPKKKEEYKGISKVRTFSPPISDSRVLWAKLCLNIEQAFKKARQFNYQVGEVGIFLKTQQFSYSGRRIKLMEKTSFPLIIKKELKEAFLKIYRPGVLYRATGCYLGKLSEFSNSQLGLFSSEKLKGKVKKIYQVLDEGKIDFGTSLFNQDREVKREKINRLALPALEMGFC
ncbi:DNA polymerase IV [Candidatus Beckwithbacteria bacterium CG10_big_fil_rev_8_21_14_0_10_34_10]|uniref:DNA polymerase IV n=1 Tax=Candidatus Beckwithbacteria bacterium CG10_big_fil_rev_8_21_14_0_10_34_10 TaxID=1974495 RepID=A0A2H0W8W5_9BACT|nr:MAG: DNA polymerase IV [Candidatus Beckwithbacteria bacterium CG10_big_fil_rev_8_21_14_0_10_34_10]